MHFMLTSSVLNVAAATPLPIAKSTSAFMIQDGGARGALDHVFSSLIPPPSKHAASKACAPCLSLFGQHRGRQNR